jgi:hypothetical protein
LASAFLGGFGAFGGVGGKGDALA